MYTAIIRLIYHRKKNLTIILNGNSENRILFATTNQNAIRNPYRSRGDTVWVVSSGRSCTTCEDYDECQDNGDVVVGSQPMSVPCDNVACHRRNHQDPCRNHIHRLHRLNNIQFEPVLKLEAPTPLTANCRNVVCLVGAVTLIISKLLIIYFPLKQQFPTFFDSCHPYLR